MSQGRLGSRVFLFLLLLAGLAGIVAIFGPAPILPTFLLVPAAITFSAERREARDQNDSPESLWESFLGIVPAFLFACVVCAATIAIFLAVFHAVVNLDGGPTQAGVWAMVGGLALGFATPFVLLATAYALTHRREKKHKPSTSRDLE